MAFGTSSFPSLAEVHSLWKHVLCTHIDIGPVYVDFKMSFFILIYPILFLIPLLLSLPHRQSYLFARASWYNTPPPHFTTTSPIHPPIEHHPQTSLFLPSMILILKQSNKNPRILLYSTYTNPIQPHPLKTHPSPRTRPT